MARSSPTKQKSAARKLPNETGNAQENVVLKEKFVALNRWIGHLEEVINQLDVEMDKASLVMTGAVLNGQPLSSDTMNEFLGKLEQCMLECYQGGPATSLFHADLETYVTGLSAEVLKSVATQREVSKSKVNSCESMRGSCDHEATKIAVDEMIAYALDELGDNLRIAQGLRDEYDSLLNLCQTTPASIENPDHVEIGMGLNNYVLSRPGHTDYSIEPDDFGLFTRFVQKVIKQAPGEIVPWADVNRSVSRPGSDPDSATASTRTRDRLKGLREKLELALGATPNSCDWVETVKGQGLRLNTSVPWCISPDLEKSMCSRRSVFDRSTDAQKMAENTPNTGDSRWRAQRRHAEPTTTDN
jgi:hypothetical protein